jgi:galactokinase
MPLNDLQIHAEKLFAQKFNCSATCIAAAPGRVNLIGEHIDYNDGFVLPMAIDRHVIIAARSNQTRLINLYSESIDKQYTIKLDAPTPPINEPSDTWANYVLGVVAGFVQRDVSVPGFDAVILSDLPVGAGLSSSAALEVATATLLQTLANTSFTPVEIALLCQQAEHDFAGMPCGLMDQFTSAMGRASHLLLLDCRSQKVEYTPLTNADLSVLIINSNVKHELTDGGYAARRAQCEVASEILNVDSLRDLSESQLEHAKTKLDNLHFRRARHVVTEIARTQCAAAAIAKKDWPAVAALFHDSHVSLRDDYEVSCDELDLIVDLCDEFNKSHTHCHTKSTTPSSSSVSQPPAQAPPIPSNRPTLPIIGARMTGGGFGGCAVALVWNHALDSAIEFISERYQSVTGHSATLFATRPSQGAAILS